MKARDKAARSEFVNYLSPIMKLFFHCSKVKQEETEAWKHKAKVALTERTSTGSLSLSTFQN